MKDPLPLLFCCILNYSGFTNGIYVPNTSGQTKTKSGLGMKTLDWQSPETTTQQVRVYQNYTNVKIQQHENDDNLKQLYVNNYNQPSRNNEQFDLEPTPSSYNSDPAKYTGNNDHAQPGAVPMLPGVNDNRYGRLYPQGQSEYGYVQRTTPRGMFVSLNDREQDNVFAGSEYSPQTPTHMKQSGPNVYQHGPNHQKQPYQPGTSCTLNCRTNNEPQHVGVGSGSRDNGGTTLYWVTTFGVPSQPRVPGESYSNSFSTNQRPTNSNHQLGSAPGGYGGVTIYGRPMTDPPTQNYPQSQNRPQYHLQTQYQHQNQPQHQYQPQTQYQHYQNVIIPQNYYSGKIQNVPRQTRPTTKCPTGASGQFPYENSCNQFLNCWNGRGVVQNCAPGTLFNSETLECDFPSKVNCISGPRSARYEKLTVKEKAFCPSEFSGIIPHYQDCSKFLNCDHGRQVEMNCPPGTLFDTQTNVCDHAYKVQCVNEDKKPNTKFIESGRYVQEPITKQYSQSHPYGSNQKTEETGSSKQHYGNNYQINQHENNQFRSGGRGSGEGGRPKCPPGFSGLMVHPTDCSKFLNCGSGMTHIMDCGPGTHFSPTLKVCDHIHNVKCSSGSPGQQNANPGPNWNSQQESGLNENVQNGEYHPGQYDPNSFNQNSNLNQKWNQSYKHSGQNWGPQQGTSNFGHNAGNQEQIPESSNQQFQSGQYSPTHSNQNQNWNPNWNQNQGSYQLSPINNNWGQSNQPDQKGHYTNLAQEQGQYNNNQGRGINQSQPDFHDDLDKKIQDLWQLGPEPTTPSYETLTFAYTENKRKPWPPPFPTNTPDNDYVFEDYDLVEVDPMKNVPPVNTLKQNGQVDTGSFTKVKCTNQTFDCGNEYCISHSLVCNGKKDCPRGSDEQDCSLRLQDFIKTAGTKLAVRESLKMPNVTLAWCAASCAKVNCKGFNFRKHDGTCYILDSNVGTSGALIILPMYDYYENQKYTISCEQVQGYLCANQKCIPKQKVCDGVNDCGDGMDEKGCTADAFDYKLRLVGGENAHSGRLELQVFGKIGYICDDMFSLRNADVACRELGFILGAAEVRGNSAFAQDVPDNETLYLMDDVTCVGNETSLRDCDFNGWGKSNCKPQEIVGVICKTPMEICPKDHWQCKNNLECLPLAFVCDGVYDCSDKSDEHAEICDAPIKMRLTQGTKGRLEVMHNGIWGTVCDDDFNDDAAKVVCKQLGHTGSAKVVKDGHFGPGTGPIWLDQVFCRGNESLLEDCIHWDWGEHNCEHAEDVGVICNVKSIPGTERHQQQLDIKSIDTDSQLPDTCGLRNDSIFNNQDDPEAAHFRVVMAGTASAGEYPWQASIRVKGRTKASHWCGAIVVSSKYVLTAAHCLTGFSKGAYFIVAGDYNVDTNEGTEQETYIEDFIIHPKFGHGNKMNNDIAVVRLKGKGFNITKDVQPVCLPPADSEYPVGLNCTISGFGSIESGKSKASRDLRAGWIPILSREVCQMPHVYGAAITDGMLCAGFMQNGVDACDGDSGGPLACLHEGVFKLYGITSWGQHCGYANKPGVYVHVAKYRKWIEETIKELANS